MNIRKAELKDFKDIQSLNKQLILSEKQYLDTTNEDWAYTTQGSEYIAKRLVSDNSFVYVVENTIDESRVIGYILAFIDTYPFRSVNPICLLENIFIKEEYRNQGLGTELIRKVKEDCASKGCKALRLHTYSENMKAIGFYRKHGLAPLISILEANL